MLRFAGYIKSFNFQTGYGFVRPEGPHQPDVMILTDAIRTYFRQPNVRVDVEADMTPQGLRVVRILNASPVAQTHISLRVRETGEIETEIVGDLPSEKDMDTYIQLIRADWAMRTGNTAPNVQFMNQQ